MRCTPPLPTLPRRSPTSVVLASRRPSSGGCGTGTSELNQTFFGFPELHDELVADLGAAELATLIAESRSRTLTDLAQLVIQTIDEVR